MKKETIENDTIIAFKAIEDQLSSYLLLTKWLNNKTVHQWYEENETMTLNKVIAKYRPKILNLSNEKAVFIAYNQQEKIGYLQYYPLLNLGQQFDSPINEKAFGIDLFIGESNMLYKGLGTTSMLKIIEYLQTTENATMFVVDPNIENFAAIRCYEKCGFIKTKKLVRQWLMLLKINN